jgi:hypothetical protein
MNPVVKRLNRNKARRPMQRTEQLPCFVTILVKLGLVEKSVDTHDAFQLYLKIGADPVVQRKGGKGFPGKVTGPYVETALKLNSLTAEELKSLKLRVAEFR